LRCSRPSLPDGSKRRDDAKFARERAAKTEDERAALGRETARRVLEALVSLEHDVIRPQLPSQQHYEYNFPNDVVARIMTDSKLLTDPRVRDSRTRASIASENWSCLARV
jgi:hypothetical protein